MQTGDGLQSHIFQDETKAREWLETRIWPNGAFCPHCGSLSVTRLEGKAHRPGLFQCNDCREQFTVTVGTLFERSKIPLHKWLAALYLLMSSKKGISAHQVHRMLGISYKSSWFMMHRLREALREGKFPGPLGFARHETVKHQANEYVRGEAHTNTIEGYFSILKRGITGTYHHVSQQHLKRYLAEFDFRYNERSKLGVSDLERTEKAIVGIVGKRLTYRRPNQRANG